MTKDSTKFTDVYNVPYVELGITGRHKRKYFTVLSVRRKISVYRLDQRCAPFVSRQAYTNMKQECCCLNEFQVLLQYIQRAYNA